MPYGCFNCFMVISGSFNCFIVVYGNLPRSGLEFYRVNATLIISSFVLYCIVVSIAL